MADPEDATWEALRREARRTESDLEVKLSSYGKLGAMLAHGGYVDGAMLSSSDPSSSSTPPSSLSSDGPSSLVSVELELQSLLSRLQKVVVSMESAAERRHVTASLRHAAARHREVWGDLAQEFQRTRSHINSLREHAELLSSVRNDISEYKASAASPSYLTERRNIHGNIHQMDELINHAQNTKGVLAAQRSIFVDMQGRLKQLGDKFPIVRNLLGSIRRKKSRDTLILTAVTVACSLFLVIYWISKNR